jgi:hypothetical protein
LTDRPEILQRIIDQLDQNQREDWEERAALMEFEGGLQRDLAEALALLLILNQP